MNLEDQKQLAGKAFYAAIGAPVIYSRKLRDYGDKLVGYGDKFTEHAQATFTEWAKEGEKVAKQLQERKVVEEIQSRVDLEKVQDRVEKLRDQLEEALNSWRESFSPASHKDGAGAPVKVPVTKAPTTKAAAKKAPATKKPAAKAAAKAPARKAPTTKKPAATK